MKLGRLEQEPVGLEAAVDYDLSVSRGASRAIGTAVGSRVVRRRMARIWEAAPLLPQEEIEAVTMGRLGPPTGWGPFLLLFLGPLTIGWQSVGVILTDRRLLMTRNAPFSGKFRRVVIDAPRAGTSVRWTGPIAGWKAVVLEFDEAVGQAPCRLLFMGLYRTAPLVEVLDAAYRTSSSLAGPPSVWGPP